MLDAYLAKTPGQRAAVSGFVGFLRVDHKLNLTLKPVNDHSRKAKKKRLRDELLRLMAENDQGQAGRLKVLRVVMAYFYDVAQKKITDVVLSTRVVASDDVGGTFVVDGVDYWLPTEFNHL